MATKAVARVKCDWSKLTQNAMPNDVQRINKLKASFDATGVKISGLPDKLPQIDWAHYKSLASDPKQVEALEKAYNSIKVARPSAPTKRLEELDYHYKMDKKRYEKFAIYANSYIRSIDIVKQKFEKMIPVKDMNMEDWSLTFPHWSATIDTPPTIGFVFDRTPGLTREEAAAFAQPDPYPFATKRAWKDWDEKYKKWYQ